MRYDDPKYVILRDALRIDPDALDEALMHHPQRLQEVAEVLAWKISERDAAKDALRQAEIAADIKLREKYKERGGVKPTEVQLSSEVRNRKLVRAATQDLLDRQRIVELWSALKDAWVSRGYMVRDMCGLYVAGYFADTSVRGGRVRDYEEADYTAMRQQMAESRKKKSKSGRERLKKMED